MGKFFCMALYDECVVSIYIPVFCVCGLANLLLFLVVKVTITFSSSSSWGVLEKRHSSPIPSRSPLLPMKPKAPAVTSAVAPSPGDSLAFRVPKDYPHSRFSKAPLAVYPPKGARNKPWFVHLSTFQRFRSAFAASNPQIFATF